MAATVTWYPAPSSAVHQPSTRALGSSTTNTPVTLRSVPRTSATGGVELLHARQPRARVVELGEHRKVLRTLPRVIDRATAADVEHAAHELLADLVLAHLLLEAEQ